MTSKKYRQRHIFRKWGLVAFFISIATVGFLLFRAPEQTQSEFSKEALTLNRGLIGDPENLDPHNFRSNQAGTILRDIGEGLVGYSDSGGIVGGVAKSWVLSEDGLNYTFTFRRDAKWSNGEIIRPNDFVSAFRMLVDPRRAASNGHLVEQVYAAKEVLAGTATVEELGIRQVSESQLEIRLHSPSPFFIQVLAHPSTFPKYSNPLTNKSSIEGPQVSNGAYVLSKRVVGSEIVITRNTNYWNRKNVAFEKVVYHIVTEAAELNRFRAGELDITASVSPGNFSIARKEFPNQLRVSPYAGVYYYGFNVENSIFADRPELRKALSFAIDRQVLVEKITGRGESPAYGWVPPGISNFSSQRMDGSNLEKTARETLARRLYSRSGFGPENPLRFQLRYNVSDVQQRLALAVQAMRRDVLGAEATLVAEEFRVLLANIAGRNGIDVFRSSWIGDYNDAQSFLQLFETRNPSNMTGHSDLVFDQIMGRASQESDFHERRLLLQNAERIVLESHVVIPLYFYVSKHLVSDQIEGWTDNVLDIHPSQYLRPTAQ